MEEPGATLAKSWTRLSDFTFTFHFHALEKEMATHSSTLAWRIPGTGEPGGLPSTGSHRVGHDWSDSAAAEVRCPFVRGFEEGISYQKKKKSDLDHFFNRDANLPCFSTIEVWRLESPLSQTQLKIGVATWPSANDMFVEVSGVGDGVGEAFEKRF